MITNRSNKSGIQPSHDEIAKKAYQLWEKDGCKPGQDSKYWFQAVQDLSATSPAPSSTTDPVPTPIQPASAAAPWTKPAAKRSRAQAR